MPNIIQIKHSLPLFAAAGLLAISSAGAADFIPTVQVGDTGNAADSTGFGSVGYDYYIGVYEVTNAQYASYLNAVDPEGVRPYGIYNANMASDNDRGGIAVNLDAPVGERYSPRANMANKPVNNVNFWDAARFANWLTTGDTETGVYNLGGVTNPVNIDIARDSAAWAAGGVAIANTNEWYKAAYYDPGATGPGDDYWRYATRSDSTPTAALADASGNITNPGANVVNFASGADWNAQNGNVTSVGGSLSASYYGTYDQDGNVFEWLETRSGAGNRIIRGGGYDSDAAGLQAASAFAALATARSSNYGFRLVSLEPIVAPATIPEPAQSGGALGGLALLWAWRSRGRRRA